jgi:tetratricopeptide (TPR) repeat protein
MKKIQITLFFLALCLSVISQTAKTKFDYTRLKGNMPPEKADFTGKRIKLQFKTKSTYVPKNAVFSVNAELSAPFYKCSNWDVVKKDETADINVEIINEGILDIAQKVAIEKDKILIQLQYRYPGTYKLLDAKTGAVIDEVETIKSKELFELEIYNNFPERNMLADMTVKQSHSLPFVSVAEADAYWKNNGSRLLEQMEKNAAKEMAYRMTRKYLKNYGSSYFIVDVYYQKPNPKKTDIDMKDLPDMVALIKTGCDSVEAAKGRNSNFVSIFKKAGDYFENMVATNDSRMVDEIPQLVYWNGAVCYLFQQEYQKAESWYRKYEKAMGGKATQRDELVWQLMNNFVTRDYED